PKTRNRGGASKACARGIFAVIVGPRRRPILMRLLACALVPFALLAGAAHAQPRPPQPPRAPIADADWARYPAAAEVQLRDLAAIVRVTPQARNDVALVIINSGPLPDPELRISRNRLIVDG